MISRLLGVGKSIRGNAIKMINANEIAWRTAVPKLHKGERDSRRDPSHPACHITQDTGLVVHLLLPGTQCSISGKPQGEVWRGWQSLLFWGVDSKKLRVHVKSHSHKSCETSWRDRPLYLLQWWSEGTQS